MSGSYTLTLGGGPCAGGAAFPDELRTRTYAAVVRQHEAVLSVTLFAPTLVPGGFRGQLQVTDAKFTLAAFEPPWDWGVPTVYPDVVERVSGGLLAISGNATAVLTSDGIVGTLIGSLRIYDDLTPDTVGPRMSCDSSEHRFSLVRTPAS